MAARKILLANRTTLGSRSKLQLNLLELGIELRNKDFIGHPWCQSLLDDTWNGRDAAAGKVMLAQTPPFLVLLLQALLGWTGLQLVELRVNVDYGVKHSLSQHIVSHRRGGTSFLANPTLGQQQSSFFRRGSSKEETRHDEHMSDISVLEQVKRHATVYGDM